MDSFKPDHVKYPLSSIPSRYDTILKAGELIFVPAGSPHQVSLWIPSLNFQVVNIEDTVAVSANYVDNTNFPGFVKIASKWARAGDRGTLDLMKELL